MLGLAIVVILVLLAIIAPFFTVDPDKQNVPERMQSPSWHHLFGTDDFGRDLFSRVVNGARVSLLSGFISVAIGLIVGVLIGVIAGYFQGNSG